MNLLKRFIRTIPHWAFVLMLIVISVNTAFLINRTRTSLGGATAIFENGYYIHDFVKPRGAVYKAGIRVGDTLVSMNGIPVEQWVYKSKVGDTVVAGILRHNQEVHIPVIVDSIHSYAPGFFWSLYLTAITLSIGSLYLLYKKPKDRSAWLFFIAIQLSMVVINSITYHGKDLLAVIAIIPFQISSCLLGPVLIHFHLLFPRPAKFFHRYKTLPRLFYGLGLVLSVIYSITFSCELYGYLQIGQHAALVDRIVFMWMSLTYLLALATAVFQFRTIQDTLSRNQLRIVIIGSLFLFISPMIFSIFYNDIYEVAKKYPLMLPVAQGIGSIFMICCIMIAIFRYRIWDIEILLKKALLYLGATLIIILSYLSFLYLVDLLTISETNVTRFAILAVSVILFLVSRDWLQRLIDRIFHRETYDSATVVAEFEEKMAGTYRDDELKSKIVNGLDEIFHFKSFILNLKRDDLSYGPAFVLGIEDERVDGAFKISIELENKLRKSQVFSLAELDEKSAILEAANGELVVPLLKDDRPYGFFLCGMKKSEKTYSMQDIRVLSLIAKRVTALFHTASLYQKDLDRQLMLERERARISQDMHDDVGASLTRISILSEVARNRSDLPDETRQSLGHISDTSRGVMEEMSQIIWALNPRNDTLEGLISYLRRFANEYLEPTDINCSFEVPESLPARALSVEVRRNVYLVVREALHNVVKHSGASSVRICLKMTEHGFGITIKDDGKGFDPGNLEFPGNGLVNMKKRMNDIGGEFVIGSEIGIGTEIELIVR